MAIVEQNQVSLSGKYLSFYLDEEEYGIEILKVREIFAYTSITPIPRTPQYVLGVINLRGAVIPVVDLRVKFGMASREITDSSCIIVIEIDNGSSVVPTGVLVDRVSEVMAVTQDQIQEAPEFGSSIETDFILGMAKVDNSVKILLDINRVFIDSNLDSLI